MLGLFPKNAIVLHGMTATRLSSIWMMMYVGVTSRKGTLSAQGRAPKVLSEER